MAVLKHGRQVAVPYRDKPETPWKYMLNGRPIRRGREYYVRMRDKKTGDLIWEGTVLG